MDASFARSASTSPSRAWNCATIRGGLTLLGEGTARGYDRQCKGQYPCGAHHPSHPFDPHAVVRRRRARNREGIDTRIKGHSYPQEWYEDAVGELLGKVGDLDDMAMTEVVRLYGEGLAKPDELTLARIEREREEASQRLARTRDVAAWQATMARLDAEQQVAKQPRQQQLSQRRR